MKKINKSVFGFLMVLPLFLAIALVMSSCDIDDSINQSPNAINESNVKSVTGIKGLLISMQVAAADFYSGDRSRVGSMWARQMCAPPGLGRPQPVAWNSYQMQTDGFVDDMWKLGYRGVRIANDIINYSPEVNFGTDNEIQRNVYIGIAKVYKALFLGELAAYYGSIPVEITGLQAPTFVSHAQAYEKVQQLLDEAIAGFTKSISLPQDLNFGGNIDKWKKVAQSLKARYFLHAMNYQKAAEHAALGIDSPSLVMLGIYNDAAGEYSPWGHWALTEVGEPIRATHSFVRMLKAEADDTRLAEYFKPNSDGNYVGYAYFSEPGITPTDDEKDIKKIVSLKKYGKYADDFPLISYQETVLIAAEALARTNREGEAVTQLNIIRKAAGLTDFAGSGDALIDEILKQKYLQLFLEGQAYTDIRRTGKMKPSPNLPMRFIYPITEKNANPNVPADSPNLVMWK